MNRRKWSSKDKLTIVLEGLKGNGQDKLIESVKKGFQVCMENDRPIKRDSYREHDEALLDTLVPIREALSTSEYTEAEVDDIHANHVVLFKYKGDGLDKEIHVVANNDGTEVDVYFNMNKEQLRVSPEQALAMVKSLLGNK